MRLWLEVDQQYQDPAIILPDKLRNSSDIYFLFLETKPNLDSITFDKAINRISILIFKLTLSSTVTLNRSTSSKNYICEYFGKRWQGRVYRGERGDCGGCGGCGDRGGCGRSDQTIVMFDWSNNFDTHITRW